MKVKNNIFNENDNSQGFFQLLFSKHLKWFFIGLFCIVFVFSILLFVRFSSTAGMLGDHLISQSIKLSLNDSLDHPILIPEGDSQIYLIPSLNESSLMEHKERLIITKEYVYEKQGDDYHRTSVDEYRKELKNKESFNKIIWVLLFILIPGLIVFFLLYFSIKWLILISVVYGLIVFMEKLFKINVKRNALVLIAIFSSFIVTIIELYWLMQFFDVLNIIIWSTLIFTAMFIIGALVISKVQVMPKRRKQSKTKNSSKQTTHKTSKSTEFIDIKDL